MTLAPLLFNTISVKGDTIDYSTVAKLADRSPSASRDYKYMHIETEVSCLFASKKERRVGPSVTKKSKLR